MLRLANRILDQQDRLIRDPSVQNQEAFQMLGRAICHDLANSISPCIIADNVGEYYEANCIDDPDYNLKGLLTNVAPPFPTCFIEANIPETSLWRKLYRQWGWYVTVLENKPKSMRALPEEIQKLEGWKWCLTMVSVVTNNKGQVLLRGNLGYGLVKSDGGYLASLHIPSGLLGKVAEKEPESVFFALFLVPLMTLNFMNCRNIELVEAKEGPTKKWLRRRQQPEVKYQMITIDPMKTQKRRPAPGPFAGDVQGGVTVERPRHICRGHFRTYTPENGRGLFGRGQYGTFWVPAHKKGNRKHGETINTYEVKAPVAIWR